MNNITNEERIPQEVLHYFEEIAERLWSGHASVMVGSGFSKNAVQSYNSIQISPEWKELGDIFYKKLTGKLPNDKEKSYLNVLKLANEVEAAFGRDVLNNLLLTNIPDTILQPSELHNKLLELDWVDVFTTNYDTLLERASKKIFKRRYETIINKDDLVWSTRPRIIKLHGSFPSTKPFVITEEDYRQYPRIFAPFVNTVQQSLLENTLCLLGFSGDDPNFLNWIGWIRDNLGQEYSSKIFLIGVLSLSLGEKKLLDKRNIIPIDLSFYLVNKDKNNHYYAINAFLEYLHSKNKNIENLNWPYNNTIPFDFYDKHIKIDNCQKAVELWKDERTKYPLWEILPQGKRKILSHCTVNKGSFMYHINDIPAPLDIELIYEFNWRIERCLLPLYDYWAKSYDTVIQKYNPFPDVLHIDNAITPNDENKIQFDWEQIKQYWVELQISLLRYYRHEGQNKCLDNILTRLNKIEVSLSPSMKAHYHYERSLYALFKLDLQMLRKELSMWKVDVSLPFWEAKRAGLMAEIGEVFEAEQILASSLNTVRNNMNLLPAMSNYKLASEEAYILFLLNMVSMATSYTKSKNNSKTTKKERENYAYRLDELIKYKCDPWGEYNYFDILLKNPMPELKPVEVNYNFGIGERTVTRYFGEYDNMLLKSYSFFIFFEEIGMPIKISDFTTGKKVAHISLDNIKNYSPTLSFVELIRTGDSKYINSLFNRQSLALKTQLEVDELAKEYISILKREEQEIAKSNVFTNRTFAISLSTMLPEVLARLCVKCSKDIKIDLFDFLKYISNSNYKSNYKGVNNLIKYLIKSLPNNEIVELLPSLLEFPIIDKNDRRIDYIDPFFETENRKFRRGKYMNIKNEIIDGLLDFAMKDDEIRKQAISRLVILWETGQLDDIQIKSFAKVLWSKTNEYNLPDVKNDNGFISMLFPHPDNIEPDVIFKKYITTSSFPVQGNTTPISFTHGQYKLFNDINSSGNKEINYKWETEDINNLIIKISDWWNTDKVYLKRKDSNDFIPVSEEFKQRFNNMINIFINVLAFNTKMINSNNKIAINSILNELDEYNMPELSARSAFINLFPDSVNDVTYRIHNVLYSKDEDKIEDALDAVIILVRTGYTNINGLINIIINKIAFRSELKLSNCISVLSSILKHNPNLIKNEMLDNLEPGLTSLLDETRILITDNDKKVSEKLECKIQLTKLICLLKKYYVAADLDIPVFIKSWENQFNDNNEFSDIRSVWFNLQDE